MNRIFSAGDAARVATVFAGGCDRSSMVVPEEGPSFQKGRGARDAQSALIHEVRKATARYHSTVQAERAGYQADLYCVAVPGLGSMGHHWLNPDLVDPFFGPLQPEVVLHVPDRSGNLKLVAVEYVVINVGQPWPTFAGQPFDGGGVPPLEADEVPHWSLHVWAWEANPSGTFAPFNPDLSCPQQTPAEHAAGHH